MFQFITSLGPVASGAQSAPRVHELSHDEVAARWPALEAPRVALALALDDGRGSIVLGRDAFDSELFGLEIGRILAAHAASQQDYAVLLAALETKARALGCDQLLRRVAADQLIEIWALENARFEVMDVGVTFGRKLRSHEPTREYADLIVRPATRPDVEELAREMVQLPWGSRFEADPAYDPARVRELRSNWLFNSYYGRAQAFFVGEMDGRPAGYVTCLLRDGSDHAEIELVGTLPGFRGRAVATRILEHALSWFSMRTTLVTVRTQATNVAAANLYERAGFTLHSSDLTLRQALTSRGRSLL